VVSTYKWLLDQGIEPSDVAFTGDSAGGAMVVTAMLLARDRGLRLPATAMPFSAWFDLTGSGESQQSNAETDKLLNKKFGDQLADILLGESGDRRDPYVSALYADLAGLPALYLQVSDPETLLDDSRALAERAGAAGVEVRLDVFAGQPHTFQMAAGRSPSALTDVRKFAKRFGHPQLRSQLRAVTLGGGTAGGSCGGRVPHRATAVGYTPDDRSRPGEGPLIPSPARSSMQTESVVIDQLAIRPVALTSARSPWGSSSRPRPRSRRRAGR
jgi:alpha/beta hydrolase fold